MGLVLDSFFSSQLSKFGVFAELIENTKRTVMENDG